MACLVFTLMWCMAQELRKIEEKREMELQKKRDELERAEREYRDREGVSPILRVVWQVSNSCGPPLRCLAAVMLLMSSGGSGRRRNDSDASRRYCDIFWFVRWYMKPDVICTFV